MTDATNLPPDPRVREEVGAVLATYMVSNPGRAEYLAGILSAKGLLAQPSAAAALGPWPICARCDAYITGKATGRQAVTAVIQETTRPAYMTGASSKGDEVMGANAVAVVTKVIADQQRDYDDTPADLARVAVAAMRAIGWGPK